MQKLELVLGFDQVVKLKGKTLRKRISSKIVVLECHFLWLGLGLNCVAFVLECHFL